MAKKRNPKKIVKYRRPLNLNVGMIIFAIIFVYMAFSVYTYIKKDRIQFYEVVEGNIVNDNEYTGIILRQESVQYTDRAGYINYFVREGKRASVGTRIYSIDESGDIASMMEENSQTNAQPLMESNLTDIKRQLSSASMALTNEKFHDIYDLQYSLEATVLEYVNFNALDNLDSLADQAGATFQQIKAPFSGVVSYAIDGFETLEPSQISETAFDRTNYTKAITKAGKLIENSVPVYKLVTSDQWSLLFPLKEEDMEAYNGITTMRVKFLSNRLEAVGDFQTVTGSDGKLYGKLDFNQYMVQFVADRYVDFEIMSDRADGLKIPVTSTTTKSFYLVPEDYMVQAGDSSDTGFMKETYSESGTVVEFIPTTIYNSSDGYFYVDMSENSPLKSGDYIVKPDSTDRFQIGTSATLEGVYNINKGYAVFKQIEILKTNKEYYTVKKGTKYGLSVYDHIVLDAGSVHEGQLIYK